MAQSIHAALSPSPQVFCNCFFFLEQLQLPSGGSAGSHKKKTVRLKEVCICLTLGQYQKKNTGVAFSHNCKLKMQYTSDLTMNISNIYITVKVLLILFTLQLHTHTTFGNS